MYLVGRLLHTCTTIQSSGSQSDWTVSDSANTSVFSPLDVWALAGVINTRLRFFNFLKQFINIPGYLQYTMPTAPTPVINKIINPPSVKVTYLWRFCTGVIATISVWCNFSINWLKGMLSMSFNLGNLFILFIRSMSLPNSSSSPHKMSPVILFKWVRQLA